MEDFDNSALFRPLIKVVSFQSCIESWEIADYNSLLRQRPEKDVYSNLPLKKNIGGCFFFYLDWLADAVM